MKVSSYLTLWRPKQHGPLVPDVPDLAQTVKPWSDLFKNFHERFRRYLKPQIHIYLREKLFLTLKKNFELRKNTHHKL